MVRSVIVSVVDPESDPHPQDPPIFGPSGSISQRYGSGNLNPPKMSRIPNTDNMFKLMTRRNRWMVS